jgi:hypothetical protein
MEDVILRVETLRRGASAVAAVATVVGCQVALPGSGRAIPPVPAAPGPCAWNYTGPIRVTHSDGMVVNMAWRGGHPENQAQEFYKDGNQVIVDSNGHLPGGGINAPFGSAQTGEVHGGINGDTITFKIVWAYPTNGSNVNGYSGTIDQAGRASGVVQNSINAIKTNWNFDHDFTCGAPVGNPAQNVPKPNNAPPANQAPPASKAPAVQAPPAAHTVTGDVDLYDKPGGNGKKIGMLKKGDAVTLKGPCPMQTNDGNKGWCEVTDTTQNRTGAVWGDFISK